MVSVLEAKNREGRTRVNGGILEGAPEWYDTHLDKLDFQWSREEELELERYCLKIHENIAKEEMTPYERCKANYEGKPKDRSLMEIWLLNPYALQTMNCHADALKPVDAYRYPKLMVKANIAAVARYGFDFVMTHPISYTEEIWGGRARMIDLGNPINVGQYPIKTMEDLEKIEVPDPYECGLYAGYLWAIREIRRTFDKYGLTGVMPLFCAFTPDPIAVITLGMMGMSAMLVALRKDRDLVMRCAEMADEFEIRFGRAVNEVAKPEVIELCIYSGLLPTKGNEEWVSEHWGKVCRTIAQESGVPCIYGYALKKTTEWVPIMYDHGVLGPGGFAGGLADIEIPFKEMIDLHRERDLYISNPPSDKVVLDGPISAIEDSIKEICAYGMSYPKFAIGFPVPDYHTPPAHIDALVAAMKKYGKSSD